MGTKTLRLDDSLQEKISSIRENDPRYLYEKDVYHDLLLRGYEMYKQDRGGISEPEEESEEEENDDRISLLDLHKHCRNAEKGYDDGLYSIGDIHAIRMYLKEKDSIDRDENLSDMDKMLNKNLLIARFYQRYAFLRYIYYLQQLYNIPYSHFFMEDKTRSNLIFVLDYTQDILIDEEQSNRIKNLLRSYYNLIGTVEGDEYFNIEEGG